MARKLALDDLVKWIMIVKNNKDHQETNRLFAFFLGLVLITNESSKKIRELTFEDFYEGNGKFYVKLHPTRRRSLSEIDEEIHTQVRKILEQRYQEYRTDARINARRRQKKDSKYL